MRTDDHSIERNVKMIAVVGGGLFFTVVAALFAVQHSLGRSQSALSEMVVPTQRELSSLTGAVGSMFLRQSEIVSARSDSLVSLANRSDQVAAIEDSQGALERLFSQTGLANLSDFPHDAADALHDDVARFLDVDSRLYSLVTEFRLLQDRFNDRVAEIDRDLRQLTEASSGVAGVLRLKYSVQLRKINEKLNAGTVDLETIRPAIVGDTRAQLEAIDALDMAVLRLGVLAGKVGLTPNDDAMNSLVANHLVQNRDEVHLALAKIERLTRDSNIAKRISQLRLFAVSLAGKVGDESDTASLASLRRDMLAKEQQVFQIQRDASHAATRLNQHTDSLRSFSQDVARMARDHAAYTVSMSRIATTLISLLGVGLSIAVAFRVRTSVLALRAQNERLSQLSRDLAEANAGLEETVAQRTASLQLVLDSTGDGMLSVSLDGQLLPERSRAITDWFGEAPRDSKLWDYLSCGDEGLRDSIEVSYSQMASDILPFEVSADQAPSRLAHHDRIYDIAYCDVREDHQLQKILVIVQDITAEVDAERVEQEAKELHDLIGNVLKDRDGFHRSIAECASLLEEVSCTNDKLAISRGLHTIKGNCAVIGFHRMADRIHHLEGVIGDEDRVPDSVELGQLTQVWQESLHQISDYLEIDHRGVEVDERELLDLITSIRNRASHDEILEIVENWRHEPTAVPLHRLAAKARNVAKRLAKNVDILVEHNYLRLPPEALQPFWSSLIHVVRNAIDHGCESSAERIAANKQQAAQVTLSTRLDDDMFEVVISDDGRGIHWETVRERARKKGLPTETEQQLSEAIFADGLSTKDVATDISGRGVGLSAVRAACRKAGGEVTVRSIQGKGTSFIFYFPWENFMQPKQIVDAEPRTAPA